MSHRLAFCSTCNARERAIVAGRCVVCGWSPREVPGEKDGVTS